MSDEPTDGPFQITAQSAPFAILPGLTMMFTLAPAAAPRVPLFMSGFILAFVGAIIGLLVYRQVKDYGALVRIGALTALIVVLWVATEWIVP